MNASDMAKKRWRKAEENGSAAEVRSRAGKSRWSNVSPEERKAFMAMVRAYRAHATKRLVSDEVALDHLPPESSPDQTDE